MVNKKYQIFVSATFEDLKDERQSAIKAILEMGHVPVGMEMFSAADEEQWEIIRRTINECDYYVVIIAHRYGSLDGKISFTEKEYDYAVSAKVPALGFVIDEKTKWNPKLIDKKPEIVKALDNFKKKVKNKHVSFWKNTDDLAGKISISLGKQFNTTPRPGWIRASDDTGPAVTAELSRLSKENASLREQLENHKSQSNAKILAEHVSLDDILSTNEVDIHIYSTRARNWGKPIQKSLYAIFWFLAPEIMIEQSILSIAFTIATSFSKSLDNLRADWPIPSNSLNSWLADFASLGLIEPSSLKHKVSDTNEYWSLSPKGKEYYNYIRRLRLELEKVKKDLPESKGPEKNTE